MGKQIIYREGSFDSAHRVMNESRKCFGAHGHTYLYTLYFEFNSIEDIGYAIDFKEIKRVYQQWIDDVIDHAAILNPMDVDYIELCKKIKSRYWLMSLNGAGVYCNPSVEQIAKEIFLAIEVLSEIYPLIELHSIKVNETPNCGTLCTAESITPTERANWRKENYKKVKQYSLDMGVIEYDDRKHK